MTTKTGKKTSLSFRKRLYAEFDGQQLELLKHLRMDQSEYEQDSTDNSSLSMSCTSPEVPVPDTCAVFEH